MRKKVTTSIEESVSERFKFACDKRGLSMNVMIEAFMNQFANDEFAVKISKDGIKLEIEEN